MEFKNIKLLILDVDGTLTDGKIYMSECGEVVKVFNVKDGYAIKNILPKHNILPVIITGRMSKILEKRCFELDIKHTYQGINDKLSKMEELCKEFNIKMEQIAYVGDDLNDLECMQKVGFAACPKDAAEQIKNIAHFVASKEGGNGAVREVIDKIIAEK